MYGTRAAEAGAGGLIYSMCSLIVNYSYCLILSFSADSSSLKCPLLPLLVREGRLP